VLLLLQLMPAIIPESHTNNAQIKRNKQNQVVRGAELVWRVGDYPLKSGKLQGRQRVYVLV